MSIQTVKATINGQEYALTYNSTSGKWEATITAPGKTSYNQTGGYYNVQVKATNNAGTSATADGSTLESLKLVVKERVAPVITILSPSSGAYVSNAQQPVVFTLIDETDGSGIDLASLAVKLDGAAVAGIATTAIAGGYQGTFTPESALSDGAHTVTVDVSDHDGNAAAQKSTTYTVDTVPPTLNLTSPTEGLITASASLTVAGTTNDATSSPVSVAIQLNGADQGAVTVGENGTFTKVVTLAEGSNTIVVTATDAAGKSSSVTRTVSLDSSVPTITAASIAPNPVDAGASMIVSVVVE